MSMDTETLQTSPAGTNGYGKESPKKGPKSELQKLQDALEGVDKAVAELDLAVRVATTFAERNTVPGMDIRANLAAKLSPVLAPIGYDVKAVRGRGRPKGS